MLILREGNGWSVEFKEERTNNFENVLTLMSWAKQTNKQTDRKDDLTTQKVRFFSTQKKLYFFKRFNFWSIDESDFLFFLFRL